MHVISRTWQPEAWLPLSKALLSRFVLTGEPTDVLTSFLCATRKGTLETEGASTDAASASVVPSAAGAICPTPLAVPVTWTRPAAASPEHLASRSRVATVARLLGEHIALLWTALVLRRRVIVYAPRTRDVLLALGASPMLAPHRMDSEREHCRPVLSPGVARVLALPAFAAATESGEGAATLESRAAAAATAAVRGRGEGRPAPASASASAAMGGGIGEGGQEEGPKGTASIAATRLSAALVEAADLARAGWYVAGTTDPTLGAAAPSAWDLYVDLTRRKCVVGEGAAASFRMTALHKRLVQSIQAALQGDAAGADARVAAALSSATSSLVQRLRQILIAKV